ncbi:anti-sigma B factor RsbW [Pullulanibacillus sp. KACC 23026]|uniref:anti-sigma B factor RsbW n=1 Tax=Pullulanibacillus sp. KACC 23026 TaxID=3028315 RepID=UPI0023B1E361|nr:anti-sigma B factor RsbW [Pullulanibacillus sp. KACC 23026]WEG12522.1 anti-sigma B factor RsbW [Pullulanibacillus sp. KACC 23026]
MKGISDVVELTIPAKKEYVGIVRLATSGVANRMGYSYDDIEDIKVAVSEACTNAVNHAYKEGEEGQVHIKLLTYENRLEIMVIDHGQSFDAKKVIQEMKPLNASMTLEQLNEGGLGLYLIETLMDQVTVNIEAGVVVFMTKFLSGDEVEHHENRAYLSHD